MRYIINGVMWRQASMMCDMYFFYFARLCSGTQLYLSIIIFLQAFGLHGHDNEDGHDHGDSDEVHVPPYLYYSIVVLAGIYCFYLFERLMAINHVSLLLSRVFIKNHNLETVVETSKS